jgi:hypothetical protein
MPIAAGRRLIAAGAVSHGGWELARAATPVRDSDEPSKMGGAAQGAMLNTVEI